MTENDISVVLVTVTARVKILTAPPCSTAIGTILFVSVSTNAEAPTVVGGLMPSGSVATTPDDQAGMSTEAADSVAETVQTRPTRSAETPPDEND